MSSSLAPAPLDGILCWDLYRMLQTEGPCLKHDMKAYLKHHVSKETIAKAKAPLELRELECSDFEDQAEACLAFMRAQALLDTDRNADSIYTPKAYLLMGRSALWLARDAHYTMVSTVPTGKEEFKDAASRMSLAKFVQKCITKAVSEPSAKALALTLLARVVVDQVASDTGPNARPGMAEAWLLRAEVELVLAELTAAGDADKVTGVRPSGRRGPWDLVPTEEDELGDDYDEHLGWTVSIPGHHLQQRGEARLKTHLADYWWGQPKSTAVRLLIGMLLNVCIQDLSRYQSLADNPTRNRLWRRELGMEHDLYRRGATALANYDAVARNKKDRELVESLRLVFPGTPFEPTEDFVRSLQKSPFGNLDSWCISCMLGGMGGGPNRTWVSVVDSNPQSRWYEMIIGTKLIEGEVRHEHRVPTPRELYQVLLRAMAGAGNDERATLGPPRRPDVVLVSYRLRDAFSGLAELLSGIDVGCELESEDSLRFACASNGTDFETGGTPKEDYNLEQTLIGQLVGICDLVKRNDLNGRVGRILKWHEDKGRWEVELECHVPGERPNKIGVLPPNLIRCPQSFSSQEEYLSYRSMVRVNGRMAGDSKKNHGAGHVLEKLRAAETTNCSDDDICAICQERIDTPVTYQEHYRGFGSGTCLPCGHAFHLSCVVPWLTMERAECPCCRCSL